MQSSTREFVAVPARREQVPLLIGLTGPSGSGKTRSGLRLAAGIQRVVGKEIYVIDTESRRALHYSDDFKFKHLDFKAPFGSLDYLQALTYCVKQGAGVVMVDQISSEHDGPGGMVDFQEAELDRMAGDDWQKRERCKMLAWAKPKAARRRLICGLLQLNCNFIFCFRAKSISKPVKVSSKTEVVPQGFVPIAGDEFIYEMTANCLLMPKSNGVPTWESEFPGEKMAMKLPEQFKGILKPGVQLSEDIGEKLARWAAGDAASAPAKSIDDYRAAIQAAATMAELGAAWQSVPSKLSKDLAAVKDARKAELQRASEQPAPPPAVPPRQREPGEEDEYDPDPELDENRGGDLFPETMPVH